ncbi:hypothetical protein, partial [Bacillus pumilus]|uniref:hypothetical protein n=1 Tax=Bacillus pumilus TaxID=1408 RepID=UPI0011A1606B
MKDKLNLSLPVKFEKIEPLNILDDRFIRVKVYIAHTGENRNKCVFSKEVLESMIPSLENIPILGYINKNDDGEEDFKGHEDRLVIEDNEIKIKNFGCAYGLIPVVNNARFEMKYAEDGVEREYLVAEGLLWRSKFPNVEEIFERDGGYKSQSMELYAPSVKGYLDEEGLYNFTQAKFEGLCILGEDVTPAMIGSTIEKFSFSDKIQNELSEMLNDFNTYFSKVEKKGDEKMDKQELENLEVTSTGTGEESLDNEEVVEGDSASTEFAKDKENDKEEGADAEEDVEDGDEEEEKIKKFTRTFELSHDDIRNSLYDALDDHEELTDLYYWISKVFDSHAIVEKPDGGFLKVSYAKHENSVTIGEFEEVFPMWVNEAEKSALEVARNNFEAMQSELKELQDYKNKIEFAEKEQKLSTYSSTLSKEEYNAIKENLSKFS